MSETYTHRTMPGAMLTHAVRDGTERSVCGTKPGRTSGWVPGGSLTCPRCQKRLLYPKGPQPSQRVPKPHRTRLPIAARWQMDSQ